MNEDLLEMPLEEDIVREDDAAPETVPVPSSLVPHLSETPGALRWPEGRTTSVPETTTVPARPW